MLLGRALERQALQDALGQARRGESAVLVLAGEAGIGKTALLDVAAELATDLQVLRARGVESEARVLFGGLLELLRPALGSLDRIPEPQAAALGGALALRPGNPGVLNNYALSRMQAGDLVAAHQLLTQASASGGADPKITRNMALLASLTPGQPAATTAKAAPASSVAKNTLPPINNGSVVMQQVPADSKAGPVNVASKPAASKVATSAPRPIVKESSTSVAQATPSKAAPAKSTATKVAKEDPKKAAKDKTPSLRMTADAASP